ncbi:hypothetical protein LAZ67_2003467 [Cordylochernes scorpioides]|uniref:Uncharacterized protein n=1 Tax=Cordylochernes scorpioides TaxID=51811 RepID=A0ABY6K4K9_9ARAC|nr:hypothetical protein LAZ67_2003467 [Cordylochernes scorpioides]
MVDQFVAFCRRFEALKRMRVAPSRFNRLPNFRNFIAPPSTFAAQDIDTPSPDLRDVIRSEVQQTFAPISAPRQLESFLPSDNSSPRTIKVTDEGAKGH